MSRDSGQQLFSQGASLSGQQLRHINSILGDIISLYNPKVPEGKENDRWWADRLYAFGNTGQWNRTEVEKFKEEFRFFTEYLELAYPARLFKKLEAYLWSRPIRKLLLEPLGFLEGNFLIIQPKSLALTQPHVDMPSRSIRLPHIGFDEKDIIELTELRIRSPKELNQLLPNFREYFFNHETIPFQGIMSEDREKLYAALESALRALLPADQGPKKRRLAEARGYLKGVLPIIKGAAEFRAERADVRTDKYDDLLVQRLLESSLYMLTNFAIKEFRKGYRSDRERTEFLKFLIGKAPITKIEKETACLYMEDGEVSLNQFTFEWLAWHERKESLVESDPLSEESLLKAGLVTEKNQLTERARRMARWVEKVVGVRGAPDEALNREYSSLVKGPIKSTDPPAIWDFLVMHWAFQSGDKKRRMSATLNVLMSKQGDASEALRQFAEEWLGSNRQKPTLDEYWAKAGANWGIHEFLRRYETGPRGFIAFPLSDLLDENVLQAVFLGTCALGPELEGENEEEVNKNKAELRERISLLKNFITIVGKPVIAVAVRDEEIRLRADAIWGEILPNMGHAIAAPLTRLKLDLEEVAGKVADEALRQEIEKTAYRVSGTSAIKDLLLFFKEMSNVRRKTEWQYVLSETDSNDPENLAAALELNHANVNDWIYEALRFLEVEGRDGNNERVKARRLRETSEERVFFSPSPALSLSLKRRQEDKWASAREKAVVKVVLQELIINAIKHTDREHPGFNVRVILAEDRVHMWVISSRHPNTNPVRSLDQQGGERVSGLKLIQYSVKTLGWKVDALNDYQAIRKELGCDPALGTDSLQAFYVLAPFMRGASDADGAAHRG
jgi:hypothetical protein